MKTILVVEDNKMNMKLFRTLLGLAGYSVLEAETAEAAFLLLETAMPDLIVMDIQLPGMNGFDAVKVLKKHKDYEKIPVVAVTSYAMEGDREKCLKAGCDAYISKPVNVKTFAGEVASCFPKKRLPAGSRLKNGNTYKGTGYRKNILIVDDNPKNVKILAGKINREEYNILRAYGGKEALERAAREAPDLILLDIMMPDMDGYEVTRRLKSDPVTRDVPVILVTALDGSEEKKKGVLAGADEFLTKPVDTAELNARIRSLLRLRKYREQLISRTRAKEVFIDGEEKEEKPWEPNESRPVILIVEDNVLDVSIIEDCLNGLPSRILHVDNAEDALHMLENQPVDIILLDILLPGMDGFQFAHKIKEMESAKNTQLVIISVRSDVDSRVRGIELGADDYLTKPLDKPIFRARIKALLEKKRYLDGLSNRFEAVLEAAITDKLTNLYNHSYFKYLLENEIKRAIRHGHPVSLIMMDLDDFKNYNDTKGHLAGDKLLREIGETIRTNVREIDVPSRYGGEEFAVLLPYTDLNTAVFIAERLRQSVSGLSFSHKLDSETRNITVSIGIAVCPGEASSALELIEKADSMLYKAKREGKNRVCISDDCSM